MTIEIWIRRKGALGRSAGRWQPRMMDVRCPLTSCFCGKPYSTKGIKRRGIARIHLSYYCDENHKARNFNSIATYPLADHLIPYWLPAIRWTGHPRTSATRALQGQMDNFPIANDSDKMARIGVATVFCKVPMAGATASKHRGLDQFLT